MSSRVSDTECVGYGLHLARRLMITRAEPASVTARMSTWLRECLCVGVSLAAYGDASNVPHELNAAKANRTASSGRRVIKRAGSCDATGVVFHEPPHRYPGMA
jgi:hypothetical protein